MYHVAHASILGSGGLLPSRGDAASPLHGSRPIFIRQTDTKPTDTHLRDHLCAIRLDPWHRFANGRTPKKPPKKTPGPKMTPLFPPFFSPVFFPRVFPSSSPKIQFIFPRYSRCSSSFPRIRLRPAIFGHVASNESMRFPTLRLIFSLLLPPSWDSSFLLPGIHLQPCIHKFLTEISPLAHHSKTKSKVWVLT